LRPSNCCIFGGFLKKLKIFSRERPAVKSKKIASKLPYKEFKFIDWEFLSNPGCIGVQAPKKGLYIIDF